MMGQLRGHLHAARSGEGKEGWYSWLRGEIHKSRKARLA
jgi:hypothetical protein